MTGEALYEYPKSEQGARVMDGMLETMMMLKLILKMLKHGFEEDDDMRSDHSRLDAMASARSWLAPFRHSQGTTFHSTQPAPHNK